MKYKGWLITGTVIYLFVISILNVLVYLLNLPVIIVSLLSYTVMLFYGFWGLNKILKDRVLQIKSFFMVELLIFISFLVLSYIIQAVQENLISSLGFMNFFEMGSYSLIITALIFKPNKNVPKKIFLLTSTSALILFFFGTIAYIFQILPPKELILNMYIYLQCAGLFLAAYNITIAIALLLYFGLNKK